MSFVKTLVGLAAGFAATRGLERLSAGSPMAAMANNPLTGAMSGQLGDMAEKMGFADGAQAVQDMMSRMGAASAAQNPMIGNMMETFGQAAVAASGNMADIFTQLTEGTAAGEMAETNAKLMIRAMVQAAKADGEIDIEEQSTILEHLGEADGEERAFVRDAMKAPLDPMALARDASEHSREQVYAMSLMAITVDNEAETKYLDTLADALGLTQETRAAIHARMGITGS